MHDRGNIACICCKIHSAVSSEYMLHVADEKKINRKTPKIALKKLSTDCGKKVNDKVTTCFSQSEMFVE